MADYNNDQYGSYEDNKHRPGWGNNVNERLTGPDAYDASHAPVEGQGRTRRPTVQSRVIKQYKPREEGVEAAEVTAESAEAIADWCGGEVVREAKSSDPTDVAISVRVPTLNGVTTAVLGWYVVRSKKGRFSVVHKDNFTSKYVETGQRQDGAAYRGAGQGWGSD